ncbi:MAG: Rab family GTPase [Promethearchaeota archaeon]
MGSKSRRIYKIFILGEGGIGKTTLIRRYTDGHFLADTKMTTGVEHSTHHTKNSKGDQITLQIWDIGGEERFRILIPHYIQGSKACIIGFDESRLNTLDNISEWIEIVRKSLKKHIPIVLISCKKDIGGINIEYMNKEVNKLINKYGIRLFLRTSSKTGENVDLLFSLLIEFIEKDKAKK